MARPESLILAIDLGSSSLKVTPFRTDGERLADLAEARPTQQAADGTFDARALASLAQQAISGCLQRVRALPGEYQFLAVTWTSFAMSWLGVDRDGSPVTPVLTYADTLSGPDADRLRGQLDALGILADTWQRTGTPIHNAYAPAQILRLARQEPDMLARVSHWQTLSSHLLSRWQGRAHSPVSNSEAGWTGLLNLDTLSWDEDMARRAQIGAQRLPPVANYSASSRGLGRPWSERWPELAQAPFFLAVGDGAGANVGSGCLDGRRTALTVGTTGAMRVIVPAQPGRQPSQDAADDRLRVPAGLWSYPVDSRRLLVGGSLTDGGALYSWLRSLFRERDGGALINEAARLQPDGHGLTVLPFLRGERAPGWATRATLTITGMTPATGHVEVARAVLEAVALRFRLIYDRLRPSLDPDCQIIASGGALQRDALWRQILADALQTSVHLIEEEEATSRGAVILALEALGLPLPPAPPTVHVSEPDPHAGRLYRAASRRQEELYAKLLGSD